MDLSLHVLKLILGQWNRTHYQCQIFKVLVHHVLTTIGLSTYTMTGSTTLGQSTGSVPMVLRQTEAVRRTLPGSDSTVRPSLTRDSFCTELLNLALLQTVALAFEKLFSVQSDDQFNTPVTSVRLSRVYLQERATTMDAILWQEIRKRSCTRTMRGTYIMTVRALRDDISINTS